MAKTINEAASHAQRAAAHAAVSGAAGRGQGRHAGVCDGDKTGYFKDTNQVTLKALFTRINQRRIRLYGNTDRGFTRNRLPEFTSKENYVAFKEVLKKVLI